MPAPGGRPPDPLSREKRRQRRWRAAIAWVLLAPFTLVYVLFLIYPSLGALPLSFTTADLAGHGTFIGLENYRVLLADPFFWTALRGTLYFTMLTSIPNTVIALGLALLIVRLGRLKKVVLACFFLPTILPVGVATAIWTWLLDPTFGVVNTVIDSTVPWFQDPRWSMPAVALVTVWWTVGFNVLLFMAGLQAIPAEVYESAAIDGAAGWRLFRWITWPSLRGVTGLVVVLELLGDMNVFDQVYLLTGGGPFDTTLVVLLYAYREGFQLGHGGYASTIGMMLTVLLVFGTLVQSSLLRRRARGTGAMSG